MDEIIGRLIIFSFFALPGAAVVWFLVSLVGYLQARPQREAQPERLRKWRVSLIASAVVAGVLVALCVGIVALLTVSLAHM